MGSLSSFGGRWSSCHHLYQSWRGSSCSAGFGRGFNSRSNKLPVNGRKGPPLHTKTTFASTHTRSHNIMQDRCGGPAFHRIFKTAVNIYTFAAQYCKNASCCSRLVTNGLCFEDTNNPAACSLQLQDGFTSISPTLTSSGCKESEEAALPDGSHVQLQLNEWSASALIHIRVFRIKTSQLSEINWPEGAKNYSSLFAWRICWFLQKWQVVCQKYR